MKLGSFGLGFIDIYKK